MDPSAAPEHSDVSGAPSSSGALNPSGASSSSGAPGAPGASDAPVAPGDAPAAASAASGPADPASVAASAAPLAAEAAPSARRRETRTRLLDAAIAVFAEEGLQGASVEAICARAGFTRGAFYSNFSTKEQLFLALLEREFERRARDLEAKAHELEPILRENAGCVSPAEAARYIVEFFSPTHDATAWFVLETEFLLLAMRDPTIAPGHHQFMDGFYASISGVIERVIAAAGRRFSLPAERAMPVLSGVYERALRTAALTGPEAGDRPFTELGDHLAELLFAITEEIE